MISKINKFEQKLKIKIKNKSLLTQALTHKSANRNFNNEKLEFLGDRVIGLVLSKKLYDLYPNESEGILDKRFAKLVNRNTCCLISWSMGMQNFMHLGDSKKKLSKKEATKKIELCCWGILGLYALTLFLVWV